MSSYYTPIQSIRPGNSAWIAKVLVIEKHFIRKSANTSTTYQRIILADEEGTQIQATFFGSDIQLFNDRLLIDRTYSIRNAYIKTIDEKYQIVTNDLQWIINRRTLVEEIEDPLSQLTLSQDFIPFNELQPYMDTSKTVDVVGILIGIKEERMVQTLNGPSNILEILLIDEQFSPIMLTLWEEFVRNDGPIIKDNLESRSVVIARRIKVVSYDGMSLATRPTSSLTFNQKHPRANTLREWSLTNKNALDKVVTTKACQQPKRIFSPPKLEEIVPISSLNELFKNHPLLWIKASVSIPNRNQLFYYLCCSRCSNATSANYNEWFPCVHCKGQKSKAIPRCKADVELRDTTGKCIATLFHEEAQLILKADAVEVMTTTIKDGAPNMEKFDSTSVDELYYFCIKQMKHAPHIRTTQRYTTVFASPVASSTGSSSTNSIKRINESTLCDTTSMTTKAKRIKMETQSDGDDDHGVDDEDIAPSSQVDNPSSPIHLE